jgi:hypothetical protein
VLLSQMSLAQSGRVAGTSISIRRVVFDILLISIIYDLLCSSLP